MRLRGDVVDVNWRVLFRHGNWRRFVPRLVVLSPQSVHLIRLSMEDAHRHCEEYPGGPSPRSRTGQYAALAERFGKLDIKDDFE